MRHLLGGETGAAPRNRWAEAWPDALAFLGGLALAWFNAWATKDLVWSLWLSSLVVGYAMIVWSIFGPALGAMWENRFKLRHERAGPLAAGGALMLAGGLFMLAFFTVHFGGFHFVHSAFLNAFFPMTDTKGMPTGALYGEVLRNYWVFVLVAAVAERKAFTRPAATERESEADDLSVTAEAITRRKRRNARGGERMMAPYKNVIRLHLLIFFFAFASFAKLDNFLVYAVVYAVYFFPWRLLGKPAAE